MAVYLNELQCGTDQQVIGFPDLRSCMAVVLLYKTAMYGMHFVHNDNTPTANQAKALREFTKSFGVKVKDAVKLYGCCSWPRRYTVQDPEEQRVAWKTEMKLVAKNLEYSGPVHGFDTQVLTGEKGYYAEFRAAYHQKRCSIYWKLHADAEFTKSFTTPQTNALVAYGEDLTTGQIVRQASTKKVALTTAFGDTGVDGALAELDYETRVSKF